MVSVLRHSFTPRIILALTLDLLALNTCLAGLAFAGPDDANPFLQRSFAPTTFAVALSVLTTALVQFSLWSFGLYSREVVYSGQRILPRLSMALGFAAFLLLPVYVVLYFMPHPLQEVPVYLFPILYLAFCLFVFLERRVMLRVFNDTPYLGNVLILGSGAATAELIREIRRQHGKTFRLAGILSTQPEHVGTKVEGCEVIGTLGEIRDHVEYAAVGTILVALPAHSPALPTEFLLKCKMSGIKVIDAGEFYETIAKKVLIEHFSPMDLLYNRNLFMNRFRWFTKSAFEKTTALLILIPALPIMAIAAFLTRFSSPGPALFRQTRTGHAGDDFTLLKFRSMVQDAERDGAVWAQANDPRVTRWGRIMRKTRIDELPQLFNILRGDMSIVGPRPERPEFVEDLAKSIPHYSQRHLVRPGLTGWAQVAFRYGASMEDTKEKLRYDLYYIKHMSLGFDLLIIMNTLRIVLVKGGAH